jgi:organic hydroperoxide reductase OsmC/OhrA
MHEFPHNYIVSAAAETATNVQLSSPGLPSMPSAPPAEFGGPGDQWSPETLLVASVADCFILTFRAIARASKFDWVSLDCTVDGTLERVDRVTQFTGFTVKATLTVPAGTDSARATLLMDKAERGCLVTNSLIADSHLEATVVES